MTALEDVDDVERFVRWRVEKLFGTGSVLASEIEEAVNEGITIMYELHAIWDPERCPRFSAFCLSLLPRRLISWHRRALRQSGRGTFNSSKGTYTYRQILSLDAQNLVTYNRVDH
jgi:hypothetical protein